jgi:TolA-binding protein
MNQQLSFKMAQEMGAPPPEAAATAEAAAAAIPQGPGKVAAQLQKMKEANLKYKNLLKMAKERIQQQEDELKRLRGKLSSIETRHASSQKREGCL